MFVCLLSEDFAVTTQSISLRFGGAVHQEPSLNYGLDPGVLFWFCCGDCAKECQL